MAKHLQVLAAHKSDPTLSHDVFLHGISRSKKSSHAQRDIAVGNPSGIRALAGNAEGRVGGSEWRVST